MFIYISVLIYIYSISNKNISSQGEVSTVKRKILPTINFDETINLFQGLGSYLNSNDSLKIKNEIEYCYKKTEITLNEFIKLFINHCHSFPIDNNVLKNTFNNICKNNTTKIDKNELLNILQKRGDKLNRDEILTCLQELTGYNKTQLIDALPNKIDVNFFAQSILGFTHHQQ